MEPEKQVYHFKLNINSLINYKLDTYSFEVYAICHRGGEIQDAVTVLSFNSIAIFYSTLKIIHKLSNAAIAATKNRCLQ